MDAAMTDIVERLRRGVYPDETGFGSTEATMVLAADEIERLRAALKHISDNALSYAVVDYARAALEGK